MDSVIDTVDMFKNIAHKRSYEFAPDTQTVAYGEFIDGCVPESAHLLNKAGKFTNKTLIYTRLSDAANETDEQISRMIEAVRIMSEYRTNIIFDSEIEGNYKTNWDE